MYTQMGVQNARVLSMANNTEHIHIRCTRQELLIWREAAKELNCSLSDFVRTWLSFASERDMRGKLIRSFANLAQFSGIS